MTLNKQRILSELGSVVNQLQSADCGCMGKLFGNSTQNMNSIGNSFPQHGNLRHGCQATPAACHGYGCHGPSCREPYSMNPSQTPQRTFSCLGQCNAPKLYSDTYNFLNENLMQPVVQEVYNDLSSISPANTIMNREIGNKMDVVQQEISAQGPTMNQNYANNLNTCNLVNQIQNPHASINPQIAQKSQMMQNPQASGVTQNQQYLGGMVPQIMNMIKGDSIANPMQSQLGQGQLTAPMIIDAPQSPHGKIGVTPLSTPLNSNYNSYCSRSHTDNNINNTQQQQISNSIPNMQQSNPMQQKSLAQQSSYGQHTQGIKKFNEMFPGVMQGLGGDLGFDPMSIAIQMNPANQQRVAMNTMQKMMNNNQNLEKILEPSSNSSIPPGVNNSIAQNYLPTNQMQTAFQNQIQNKNVPMEPATNANYPQKDIAFSSQPMTNSQINNAAYNPVMSKQNTLPSQPIQSEDPNTGASTNLQTVRNDLLLTQANDKQLHSQQPQPVQLNANPTIKEPIFPVDTTKQKIYHNLNHNMYKEPAYYNTLGQPVEKLPANMYHHPIPNLPQTLSPQPTINQGKYSNVKLTESRTSLMRQRPTDKTPSRSQLQQIYNQYKGSQSFTQQSVKTPVNGAATHSDRRLNAGQDERQQITIPVEKVGGDSAFDRQPNDHRLNNVALVKHDQVGDVLNENKPSGDIDKLVKDQPNNNRKCRNGLQDLVYTSYPTSAAWTFHGNGQPVRQHSPRRTRRYNRY